MSTDPRILAAERSLAGLSVGDAFGEQFFPIACEPDRWDRYFDTRQLPPAPWHWTDDTAMAVSVVEVLKRFGRIGQDALAEAFARRYAADDRRGYGGTAHGILTAVGAGLPWREVAPAALGGMGSMGNGGAMRVAPLGAFFADAGPRDLAEEARRSAEVTHAHPEGQAGAVAVALAAAFVARRGPARAEADASALFDHVLAHTPDGATRARIRQARELPLAFSVETAVAALGNGSKLTAPDTVPFCLWSAARAAGDYVEAMWATVSAGGDMDTNCAIVGGILASAAAEGSGPPAEWLARREPLAAVEQA